MATPNILIIDDSKDIHHIIKARLGSIPAHLYHAFSAAEGIQKAQVLDLDLVLLDVHMPEIDGFEVCRIFKSDPKLAMVPIIFLTGDDDVDTKVKGFEAGATDYIIKPFEPAETRARISSAIRAKKYLDLLAEKAQIDGLTGLWNRRYCDQKLHAEIEATHRYGRDLSVLMIDIDHFKSINDTYGHPFGDEVLQEVAQTLETFTRASDFVCRYGGEEFIVLLPNTSQENALVVAEKLHDAIRDLIFHHRKTTVTITCSVGLASTEHFTDLALCDEDKLLAMADGALYKAKETGRDKVVVHTPEPPQLPPQQSSNS